MEPKTGKRIVSRGKYLRIQATRISLACLTVICGFMLIEFGGDVVISALDFFCDLRYTFHSDRALYAVESSVVTFCFYKGMKTSFRKFATVEDVVPLTRANTAHLPAPGSLVRASSAPTQAQKAVLLRAAAEGQERHEEQLVRAVNGPE